MQLSFVPVTVSSFGNTDKKHPDAILNLAHSEHSSGRDDPESFLNQKELEGFCEAAGHTADRLILLNAVHHDSGTIETFLAAVEEICDMVAEEIAAALGSKDLVEDGIRIDCVQWHVWRTILDPNRMRSYAIKAWVPTEFYGVLHTIYDVGMEIVGAYLADHLDENAMRMFWDLAGKSEALNYDQIAQGMDHDTENVQIYDNFDMARAVGKMPKPFVLDGHSQGPVHPLKAPDPRNVFELIDFYTRQENFGAVRESSLMVGNSDYPSLSPPQLVTGIQNVLHEHDIDAKPNAAWGAEKVFMNSIWTASGYGAGVDLSKHYMHKGTTPQEVAKTMASGELDAEKVANTKNAIKEILLNVIRLQRLKLVA